jgi:hypothetical protein
MAQHAESRLRLVSMPLVNLYAIHTLFLSSCRNHDLQGNVVFATELARRYGDKGIVSTSLHPGNHHVHFRLITPADDKPKGLIATDIGRDFSGIARYALVRL